MLALKYLLAILGIGLFGSASALVVYDIFLAAQLERLLRRNKTDESGVEAGTRAKRAFRQVRWRLALQLATAGAGYGAASDNGSDNSAQAVAAQRKTGKRP